jgi:hypothetical protein
VGRYLLSLARDKDVIMVNRQQIEWRNRNFLRGLAIGALVLTFFGAGWAIAPALLLTTSSGATALALIVVALITVALVVGCLALLRDAQRIPVDSSPKALARGRAVVLWLTAAVALLLGRRAADITLASWR